jgi:hypothetical protein
MFDGRPTPVAEYVLRERLRYWFGNQQRAIAAYAPLSAAASKLLASDEALPACPYGIALRYKLGIAHGKLTSEGHFPEGRYDY